MRISDWSSDVCSSDLLCDQGGRRWLAPLYDLVPTIYLPESLVERTPAMRIGQAARIDRIGVDDWADFAEAAGYRKAYVLERVQSLAGKVLACLPVAGDGILEQRSEEHTSELQSLMRISYAVFCLKKTT